MPPDQPVRPASGRGNSFIDRVCGSAVCLLVLACGSTTLPLADSLAGSWTGPGVVTYDLPIGGAAQAQVSATVILQITESGGSITGTGTWVDNIHSLTNLTLTGSRSGASATLTLATPVTCSSPMMWSATVASDGKSLSGSLSGDLLCNWGSIVTGSTLSLTRSDRAN